MGDIIKSNININNKVNSIISFCNLNNKIINNSKETVFIRLVGVDNSTKYINDIKNMDSMLTQNTDCGYLRLSEFPKAMDFTQTQYYTKQYEVWNNDGKKFLSLKNSVSDKIIMNTLNVRLIEIENLFSSINGVNSSICKNFIIKSMYWLDNIICKILKDGSNDFMAKIVVDCDVKRQEYLFLYLLAKTGVDIMILLPNGDLELDEKLKAHSVKIMLPNLIKVEIPKAFEPHRPGMPPSLPPRPNMPSPRPHMPPPPPPRPHMPPPPPPRPHMPPPPPPRPHMPPPPPPREPRFQQHNILSNSSNKSQSTHLSALSELNNNQLNNGSSNNIQNQNRIELSFEELARLATSVVMIGVHNRSGEIVASGSGIMISKEGYILTNCHVINSGVFYSVRIENDNNIYKTNEVIKYNTVFDLAVIRINRICEPLKIYRQAKSLVRGQKVVAIGSPLGLFNSVSDGIISGFRNIRDVDMIQFTAPISHGSSGGAVLNMYGEVIGISTAGIDDGQNINLAVDYRAINNFIGGFIN